MKRILVIYYSQSGQLKDITDSVLAPISASGVATVEYEQLKPIKPFPFPWTAFEFADAFAESFDGIPCELEPLSSKAFDDYDLIILAYQVWYLAPSIPVSSFLQSPDAEKILKNTPVVTIIGCRNMWLLAQERVKKYIKDAGGKLTGNIVLKDRTSNLVGVLTITAWLLTGNKNRFMGIFPYPGVSDDDINRAAKFGEILISELTSTGKSDQIKLSGQSTQTKLNQTGAVDVVPDFIIFESRISKIFSIWAKFIRSKGGPGNPARKGRVRLFIGYLLTAIFLISPLATIATATAKVVKKKSIQKKVDYFSSLSMEETDDKKISKA